MATTQGDSNNGVDDDYNEAMSFITPRTGYVRDSSTEKCGTATESNQLPSE